MSYWYVSFFSAKEAGQLADVLVGVNLGSNDDYDFKTDFAAKNE